MGVSGQKHPKEKEMHEGISGCLRTLYIQLRKEEKQKQGRKGKIYPVAFRVPEKSKEK